MIIGSKRVFFIPENHIEKISFSYMPQISIPPLEIHHLILEQAMRFPVLLDGELPGANVTPSLQSFSKIFLGSLEVVRWSLIVDG